MSEAKEKVPVFYGAQDNFLLWRKRILLILADNDAGEALNWDDHDEAKTAKAQRKVVKACSIICRGLGDIPLAAVLKYSDSAKLMWEALNKSYNSCSVFNKSQVFSQIMRKQ